jgi:NodT family efflux transporter outer membrane factor (OMF) lipoprotein
MRRRVNFAFATVVVVTLAGCAVGPDYRPTLPPPMASGAFAYVPPVAEGAKDVPTLWWRLYDDPVLNGLVERALAANADVRVAQANLDAARASLRVVRTTRLPATALDGGATYGRSSTTTQIADSEGRAAPDRTIDTFGGSISYKLDLFGRNKRSIEAASADAGAAEAKRDTVRVMVAAETTRAYVSACSTAHQGLVAKHTASVAAEERDVVVRQFAAGGATRFDLARTDTLYAQTLAEIPSLDGEHRAALFALAAMLGAGPSQVLAAAAECAVQPAIGRPVPVGDGAALIRRRPDIRAAERNVAAASARIGVAQADLYPSISLFGSASTSAPNLGGLGTRPSTSFGLGPLISWSFPNVAAARARIAAAKATDRAAIARFDGAVLTALKEVEQSLARYSAALDRMRHLEVAAANAEVALHLARTSLAAGSVSRLDMLEAERTHVGAQASLAAAEAQRGDTLVTLFKALGGGWQTDRHPAD